MTLVALLLRAFPRRFRETFGPDLVLCVRDARSAVGRNDALSVARFWAAVVPDLLRAAAGEWMLSCRERLSRASVSAACGVLLLAGAAANVLFDVLSATLSMGIGAIVLTVVAAAAGGRLVLRARS
jgi:hypothetical protein